MGSATKVKTENKNKMKNTQTQQIKTTKKKNMTITTKDRAKEILNPGTQKYLSLIHDSC